ncbi:EAL and HDOD domain-containing protein [Halomonas sp. HNIBRBA4712]|uniref:EAL and HDOD domain-containing protein n=1 Tax=Halomonas sp. HNIBRBA4712 TaxID=3373087 RepID=UPI003745ACA3
MKGTSGNEAAAQGSYTIALQPIVDKNLNHIADELLYRGSTSDQAARIDDDVQATARACAVAIYEIGLEKLCGPRKLFINVSEQWLLDPNLYSLPTEQVVLEILETTPPTQEVKLALQTLKDQGYVLAIDDFQTSQDHESLLEYCGIVKLDVSTDLPIELIERLKNRGLTLLAERVETYEEYERFKALGFSLFQGYFYERPRTQRAHSVRRSSPKANQLRIISKLYRSNINISEISALIAQDPYLIDAVLRRANSASKGLSQPTYKLNTCIQHLGINELRMLVTVVLLASNGPASKLNLINGLTKALACEQVAAERRMDEEEGFVLGLFSHMPIIMGISLDALMKELPLGNDFYTALVDRKGKLGKLLNDIELAEQGGPSQIISDTLLVNAAARARSLIDSSLA